MSKRSFASRVSEAQSNVTKECVFWNRRQFIERFSMAVGLTSIGGVMHARANNFDTSEPLTTEKVVTGHNNFYEFSLSKDGPSRLAKNFHPGNEWTIDVSGEVEKPLKLNLDQILKMTQEEERIYRLRCVEAWSIVVPWQGFQLSALLKRLNPTSKAKYVEFVTLNDEKRFPGQKRGSFGFHSLDWPYVEGLRIDEAMNPLTFMATGVYGKPLPGQNGAPIRLVVPWKYGFKSIKSIVAIRFTESQPLNSWQRQAPSEYGFYANVNPKVDHPRWSQASERRITDDSFFGVKRIDTRLFNGYQEHVAHLYKGMDLSKHF